MNQAADNEPVAGGTLGELAFRAEKEFQARFFRVPEFVVAAPGRVNLIGEHIDYNDGFVLPMAIERYVVIAAALRDDQSAQSASFYSNDLAEGAEIALAPGTGPHLSGWGCYAEGVMAGFAATAAIPPFDALIQSNVPLGGGLSSSAALEVCTATLLEALTGKCLDPTEKALLCQRAEHRFAGVPCGIMDQFSSVFGKQGELMLLDCISQQIQAVPFVADEITVLIINSNVKHTLAGSEYAKRRTQCESALAKLNRSSWRDATMDDLESNRDTLSSTEYRRARHVVGEIARTLQAGEAFRRGDWARVGELMYASHESLQKDYDVSCDELDTLVELAREVGSGGGVIGSRMTGGGFGGCTLTLVEAKKVENISHTLASRYEAKTGIRPHCFASRPARGAHVIRAQR